MTIKELTGLCCRHLISAYRQASLLLVGEDLKNLSNLKPNDRMQLMHHPQFLLSEFKAAYPKTIVLPELQNLEKDSTQPPEPTVKTKRKRRHKAASEGGKGKRSQGKSSRKPRHYSKVKKGGGVNSLDLMPQILIPVVKKSENMLSLHQKCDSMIKLLHESLESVGVDFTAITDKLRSISTNRDKFQYNESDYTSY